MHIWEGLIQAGRRNISNAHKYVSYNNKILLVIQTDKRIA